MCDTLVALSNSTENGVVLFAKNSDRDPNEAHYLEMIEAEDFDINSSVKCTYIEIPQVSHTYSVLLGKPFWIWGAEMGANEHGVVIGNEAVFTKVRGNQKPSLIGMDLLRLGLERGADAEKAMRVIIDLLEKYGQGGNCGFRHPLFYDNSFIIADDHQAWVLETAGKFWAAEKVKDIRSISNVITIGNTWDLASEGLVEYAVAKGWSKSKDDFNFGRCYSDFLYTNFGGGRERFSCTTNALRTQKGKINQQTMMTILRSHNSKNSTNWSPDGALTGADVCMHAGFGPIRISQTTGSMVSVLNRENSTHWMTATSAPCTSIFKPIWFGSGLPEQGPIPDGKYDSQSIWWQHELLHRATLLDYPNRIIQYQVEQDALQSEIIQNADEIIHTSYDDRSRVSEESFSKTREFETRWTKKLQENPQDQSIWFYRLAWQSFNRNAGITL